MKSTTWYALLAVLFLGLAGAPRAQAQTSPEPGSEVVTSRQFTTKEGMTFVVLSVNSHREGAPNDPAGYDQVWFGALTSDKPLDEMSFFRVDKIVFEQKNPKLRFITLFFNIENGTPKGSLNLPKTFDVVTYFEGMRNDPNNKRAFTVNNE